MSQQSSPSTARSGNLWVVLVGVLVVGAAGAWQWYEGYKAEQTRRKLETSQRLALMQQSERRQANASARILDRVVSGRRGELQRMLVGVQVGGAGRETWADNRTLYDEAVAEPAGAAAAKLRSVEVLLGDEAGDWAAVDAVLDQAAELLVALEKTESRVLRVVEDPRWSTAVLTSNVGGVNGLLEPAVVAQSRRSRTFLQLGDDALLVKALDGLANLTDPERVAEWELLTRETARRSEELEARLTRPASATDDGPSGWLAAEAKAVAEQYASTAREVDVQRWRGALDEAAALLLASEGRDAALARVAQERKLVAGHVPLHSWAVQDRLLDGVAASLWARARTDAEAGLRSVEENWDATQRWLTLAGEVAATRAILSKIPATARQGEPDVAAKSLDDAVQQDKCTEAEFADLVAAFRSSIPVAEAAWLATVDPKLVVLLERGDAAAEREWQALTSYFGEDPRLSAQRLEAERLLAGQRIAQVVADLAAGKREALQARRDLIAKYGHERLSRTNDLAAGVESAWLGDVLPGLEKRLEAKDAAALGAWSELHAYFGSDPRLDSVRAAAAERLVALALVVDRSGSMGSLVHGRTKMSYAKASALRTAAALGPGDEVAVVTFGNRGMGRVELPRTDASELARVREGVEKLTHAAEQTFLLAGLRVAAEELRGSKAGVRHLVVISDGEFHLTESQALRSLANELATRERITLSVIAITDAFTSAEFLSEAEMLTRNGGGRFLTLDDAGLVPQLVIGEVTHALSSAGRVLGGDAGKR